MAKRSSSASKSTFLDLLKPSKSDPKEELLHLAAQIDNILCSYDDEFDAVSELAQNAMDAVLARWDEVAKRKYKPRIEVTVDADENTISVLDNGVGVEPSDFNAIFRPNVSLKKRLQHSSARGEKGAGVTFLQFDHKKFRFETKTGSGELCYELENGPTWFSEFRDAIDVRDIKDPKFKITEKAPHLKGTDRGSFAQVEFDPDESNMQDLAEICGVTCKTAFARWEYILRTRTAIGFVESPVSPVEQEKRLPEALKQLKVVLTVVVKGKRKSGEISPRFYYPHLMKPQKTTRIMVAKGRQNDLLWDFFDASDLGKHFAAQLQRKHLEIAEKYDVRVYVSYAHKNDHYESLFGEFCGFEQDDFSNSDLPARLIQVNGGFQVAVREYPNGRRHNFIQRGGSEGKSRAFVIFNFRKGYKPDYGRKNLAHDCRDFVNTACKAFINFVEQRPRRELLHVGRSQAPHGANDIESAKEDAHESAEIMRQRGLLSASGKEGFSRNPSSETEVVLAFYRHIMRNELVGYKLYGPKERTMFDELFDFSLSPNDDHCYPDDPLGIQFRVSDKKPRSRTSKWIEYKSALEYAVQDFRKKPGENGKKWFNLCDLVVCETADDADSDGYTVEPVEDHNVDERQYYGVTHILRSTGDSTHSVQVISLRELREVLVQKAGTGAVKPSRRRKTPSARGK